MSGNSETPETEETPTTSEQTNTLHGVFRNDLKTRIAEKNPEVREMLLDEMTKEELQKRRDIVRKLIQKIDEKTKELRKTENQGSYAHNVKGEKIGEPTFTKEQADTMKKMREDLQKHHAALSKALEQGDYQKATELTQK